MHIIYIYIYIYMLSKFLYIHIIERLRWRCRYLICVYTWLSYTCISYQYIYANYLSIAMNIYAYYIYVPIYLYIYTSYIHGNRYRYHHHDVRLARISLTLFLHVSLSFIAFGRSSGLHPVSSHSCCMNVRAGRPAFDWPYAGVHRSTSLTISSLLLQQCPACLVRLACIVFVISGRWPYSWRRVGCCCQDLFNIARNILV